MPTGLSRLVALSALAASCTVFALGAASRLSGFEVWDDGLMFARYAENLARDGAVAWNPADGGGQPTWGLTSLGHLGVVSAARWVLRPLGGDALAWAVAASWLAGCGFLVLMLWAAWRHDLRAGPLWRLGLVAWTGVCLAAGFRSVGAHLGTGMDTMTSLVWLTLFLLSAHALERPDPSDGGGTATSTVNWMAVDRTVVCTSIVAGLTFFVRPDATLFPAAVLAALVVFGRDRRRAVAASAAAAGVLGATGLAARGYFGTWLPLPYYAKSGGGHYGDAFAAHYEGVAAMQLGVFALAFWLPIFAVLFELLVQPRRWWRESAAMDKGLVVAVIAFGAYHLTQVAPIMGGGQRFYQPMVPALLWLSWGAVRRLRDPFEGKRLALAMAGLVLAVSLGQAVAGEWTYLQTARSRPSGPTLDLDSAYRQRASHYWPALDLVTALPPETMIAATEVGLPGAMNPRKAVVDLAGLHDPRFAFEGFSADRVFTADDGSQRRPEVIYMPHPHYEAMLDQLRRHPVFQGEYRLWTAAELDSVLGVALFRGSVAEKRLAPALDRLAQGRSTAGKS